MNWRQPARRLAGRAGSRDRRRIVPHVRRVSRPWRDAPSTRSAPFSTDSRRTDVRDKVWPAGSERERLNESGIKRREREGREKEDKVFFTYLWSGRLFFVELKKSADRDILDFGAMLEEFVRWEKHREWGNGRLALERRYASTERIRKRWSRSAIHPRTYTTVSFELRSEGGSERARRARCGGARMCERQGWNHRCWRAVTIERARASAEGQARDRASRTCISWTASVNIP